MTGSIETPVEPMAETVKVVAANAADGVPEMTPVAVLRVRPAGRAGSTWKTMDDPMPVTLGAVVVIGEPAVPAFTIDAGVLLAPELEAAKVTEVLSTPPPEPTPVITNWVEANPAVGVPEITPVVGSNDSPAGSAGVTV